MCGSGPHFCLAASLVRAELRAMMDAALDFLPQGARVRPELIKRPSPAFLPENLPVDFGT